MWIDSNALSKKRRNRPAAVAAGLMCALALPALATGLAPSAAFAQAVPVGQPAALIGYDDGSQYRYDIALPAGALAALQGHFGKGFYSEKETITLNGRTRTVISTVVSWPAPNFIEDSGFATVNGAADLGVGNTAQFVNLGLGKDPAWKASAAKLQAAARPAPTGWQAVKLRILVLEAGDPASFGIAYTGFDADRKSIADNLLAFRKSTAALSQSTKNGGQYFPEVQIPANLDGVRQAMLDYGNKTRLAPQFRRAVGAKVATDIDLSKSPNPASVRNPEGKSEPVHPQPDMVLDPALNKMAQWQAEALAANKVQGGHYYIADGGSWTNPATGQKVAMRDLGARGSFFGVNGPLYEISSGASNPGDYPYNWMAGDTHYRWYFGVDGIYPKIGYGAARDKDGKWYYVGVATNTKPTP